MSLKANEIAEVLKSQLANLDGKLDISETGTVLAVGDGVAKIYGLDKVMAGELVDFGNSVTGMILNLEELSVGAAILGDETLIKEGSTVKRTGKIVQVPIGKELLGRVVNALGQPIDGLGDLKNSQFSRVEVKAPGIIERKSVHEPLQTGIKAIDAMICSDRTKAINGCSSGGSFEKIGRDGIHDRGCGERIRPSSFAIFGSLYRRYHG